MSTEGYCEITLNDFLLNAGVVGLLRVFRYADDFCDGCSEGKDYIISGQSLYISNKFLLENDIGELFVGAIVHYLGQTTKFERVMNEKSKLDKLYAEPKPEDKEWKKGADNVYKEFIEMLLKNSFKSGYVILSGYSKIISPTEDMVQEMKKESDYIRKKELHDRLWVLLRQKEVSKILCFKDLLYSVINMFYSDNKGNGPAFLSERDIDPSVAYNSKFLEPLRKYITDPPTRGTGCISCHCITDKKLPITMFVDTADDLGKKKSYYWNCNPDAYLCPLCAFVCSIAPLGFSYFKDDGVFINNNSDVATLREFANVLEEGREESGGIWYKLYNTFTSQKISQLSHKVNNIQVVMRIKRSERYSLNMIDKRTIKVFNKCSRELESLKNRYAKNENDFINVYQQTMENIANRRNQFLLMSKLIYLAIKGNLQTGYIFNILRIQITQKGGDGMENNLKRAYVAKKQGEILRAKLTEGLQEADKDNKLRGLVYQMLSAVSLGNRDKYMELVLRTYAGENLAVPDIFLSCFGGDEDFKEIGFAYLLGLKSAGYKKEEEAQ